MNPENQLMLLEIQNLFADQAIAIHKHFNDQRDFLQKHLSVIENAMEKHFVDSEIAFEHHIVDAKLHQEARVSAVEAVADKLEKWHIETEATVNDLRLKVGKLTRIVR